MWIKLLTLPANVLRLHMSSQEINPLIALKISSTGNITLSINGQTARLVLRMLDSNLVFIVFVLFNLKQYLLLNVLMLNNSYPRARNFINKVLMKTRNRQHVISKCNQQPEQSMWRVTLPYPNGTSEITARLPRPFNINVTHKPIHKLSSYSTKHKDKTTTTETKNAIYMMPCMQRLSTKIYRTNIKKKLGHE